MFAVWMDPLVRRLETVHALPGWAHGLSTLVYADDLLTTASSTAGMRVQRDAVVSFMDMTGMQINHDKVVYACTRGQEVAAPPLRPQQCRVVVGSETFRYLGTLLAPDGSTGAAESVLMQELHRRCARLEWIRLSPPHAVRVVGTWIMGLVRYHVRIRRWSMRFLESTDVRIRRLVRSSARLPADTCLSAFYEGLGLPSVVEVAAAVAAESTLQRLNGRGPFAGALARCLGDAQRALELPGWPTETPGVVLGAKGTGEVFRLCEALEAGRMAIVPTTPQAVAQGSLVHLQQCVSGCKEAERAVRVARLRCVAECFTGSHVRDLTGDCPMEEEAMDRVARRFGAAHRTGKVPRDTVEELLDAQELERRDSRHLHNGAFAVVCTLDDEHPEEVPFYLYRVEGVFAGAAGGPPEAALRYWEADGATFFASGAWRENVCVLEPVLVETPPETDEEEHPPWAVVKDAPFQLTAAALMSRIRRGPRTLSVFDVLRMHPWRALNWSTATWVRAKQHICERYRPSRSRRLFRLAVDVILREEVRWRDVSAPWVTWWPLGERCQGLPPHHARGARVGVCGGTRTGASVCDTRTRAVCAHVSGKHT
jgi:hypothetical protein